MKLQLRLLLIFYLLILGSGCDRSDRVIPFISSEPVTIAITDPIARKLVAGGIAQTSITKTYDPAYVALKYPGGDVAASTGVCTDVIVRAYRQIGLHIAIVTNIKTSNGYQMVHNACCGTKVETIPRNWKINSHYRYLPRV
jgi:uncharacterized protein YijF (DUF1287 family)